MPDPTPPPRPASAPSPFTFEALAPALADPTRWRMLGELSTGEPLMIVEMAERLGLSPTCLSKHAAILRAAGVVEVTRARLYRIAPQYLPSPGQRIIDFGRCLLRFD